MDNGGTLVRYPIIDAHADAAVTSANDGLAVSKVQLQLAQAQLDIAQINLERATQRSPVNHLISARNGQIGAITTSSGEPIFRAITDGIVDVQAEVIETALGQMEYGDSAELSVAGVCPVMATARRISPTVDPVNRLGTIRIDVPFQPGLRSGVFASGSIITEERQTLAIPTTAALTDSTCTYVLLIKNNTLEKRPVDAGLIWNDLREIVEGLEAVDVVVAAERAITSAALASTIRTATIGTTGGNVAKFNTGERQIPIIVRLEQDVREDLFRMSGLRISSSTGAPVPLSVVADFALSTGPTSIEHYDRQYRTTVEADVADDFRLGPATAAVKALPVAQNIPEGTRIQPGSDAEVMGDISSQFALAMSVGILLVYVVLALSFSSFVTPITILMSLPLAIGRAIFAFYFLGLASVYRSLSGF